VYKDHSESGYSDGRYRHSDQIRLEKEAQIIIEIDLEVDKQMEQVESDIQRLRIHKTAIDPNFMPDVVAQLDEQLAGKQEELLTLQNRQALIKQGKGLAEKPLNSYRIAYHRGFQAFLYDEDLLGRHRTF
jgi:hypothetical protein